MKNIRPQLIFLAFMLGSIPSFCQTVATTKIDYSYLQRNRVFRLPYFNIGYQLLFPTKDSFYLFYNSGCIGPGLKIDSGKFEIKANKILVSGKDKILRQLEYKEIAGATVFVNQSANNSPLVGNNSIGKLPYEGDNILITKNPLSVLWYFDIRPYQ